MWLIFQKSDGRIVSASAGAEIEQSKDEALKEVVQGLVGSNDVSDYDAVQVKDREQFSGLARSINRGSARVKTGLGGKLELVDEGPESSSLSITTNAGDFHPVDNVPLIPADGHSFLVVTLQRVDERGQALAGVEGDDDTIWLRIDHGRLVEDNEEARPIRSVVLANGTASFRVYSETERRLATVQMLSTNPALQAGGLQVEFI